MMMNLFSTFDPCTGLLSMNWLSSLTIMFMLNFKYWVNKNNMKNFYFKILMNLNKELSMITKFKTTTLMFTSLFIMILMNNMMGLLPYVFTSSSHLIYSLSMALPMWFSLMIYGWTKKTKKMLSHTVPVGTPYMLMPFMVLIETISNLIRPGSLSVRLSANMIAGHLLMSLLGSTTNLIIIFILMVMFIMLMMFELAVSIIQSYVFMTLTTLYSSEIKYE